MRRAIQPLVLPLFLLVGLAGCPDEGAAPEGEPAAQPEAAGEAAEPADEAAPTAQGAEAPQMAVVRWLDAVDAGRWEDAAVLAPPTFGAQARRALAQDLEESLQGARRLDDVPFGMSPPEEDRTFASVSLGMPDGSRRKVRLDLVRVGGQWFAEPAEPAEAEAEDAGTGIVPVDGPQAGDAGEDAGAEAPAEGAPADGGAPDAPDGGR